MANKKCVICGEYITDEAGIPYKQRYAHQKCFNIAIKTLQGDKAEKLEAKNNKKKVTKAKPKAELKDCLSEEEYKYKTDFYNYIRSLTEDNQISAKVYALSDNYIKRYGFTFEGMYNTVKYLNEYTDKTITGDVIGIIPYYYDEAQAYFESIKRIEKSNESYNIDKMYKEKIILIPSKKVRSHSIKQIDISKI